MKILNFFPLLPWVICFSASQGFCAQGLRFEDLPALPKRSHTYFELESIQVPVPLPGRSQPLLIHCKVAGEGAPVLLLHGLMTDSYSFRYLIPLLASHYRVIVPDLPGAGQSDAPVDFEMSPESIAQMISGLIGALGLDRPYVVGNSLGGYEALWFASLYPDQLRRLVVIHAPGFIEAKYLLLDLLADLPLGKFIYLSLVKKDPKAFTMQNIHYEDPSILSQQEVLKYSAIFKDEARTEVFWHVLGQSLATGPMQRLHKRLPSLKVPTLLLWAKHDALASPAFGPRFQKLIPGSQLVWLDHTSHFTQVEVPEQTAEQILQFDSDGR